MSKRIINFLLWLIVSDVASCANAAVIDSEVMDFDLALHRGLTSSPQIRKAETAVEIAQYDLIRARSPFLPHLDMTISTQRIKTYSNIPGVESLILSGRDSVDHATSRLQLGLNVFNGGADVAAWNLAQEKEREVLLRLKLSRQSMAEKILTSYHEARMEHFNLRAAQLRNLLGQEKLKKAQLDFDRGQISALTLAEAKYEQSKAEMLQGAAERKYRGVSRNLLLAIGVDSGDYGKTVLADIAVDYRKILIGHGFVQTNTATETLLSSSRVIQAEYGAKRPEGRYWPKVDIFARTDQTSISDGGFSKALEGLARDKSYYGINLTWNMFDGLDSYAEVQAKAKEINSAKADYDVTLEGQRRDRYELNQSLKDAEEQLLGEQNKLELILSRLNVQKVELEMHRRSDISLKETEVELKIQQIEVQKNEEVINYMSAKNTLVGSSNDD